MTTPSPFRKLVPPLVWPVGVLLVMGYCYIDHRDNQAACRPPERCAPIAAVQRRGSLDSTAAERAGMMQSHSVAVAFTEADMVDLRIPLLFVLGGVLAILVVRRRKARGKGAESA